MDQRETVNVGRKGDEVFNAGPGEHAVAFHDQDELAQLTGRYLRAALAAGGTAVVVARPQQRAAISAWLSRTGIDIVQAWADGFYVTLDAEELLSRFMLNGRPDAALFWAALSPVLADACRGNAPVRVFGEMVAVLWESGQPEAAIELEALWNEIGGQYPFALLCGYPAAAMNDEAASDALAQVCCAHSAVMGAPPSLVELTG